MPKFQIRGHGKETGRKRSRVFYASSEEKARELAAADGTVVDEIERLPDDPPPEPTERQLDFASDLGIAIPDDADRDDVSDLISQKLGKEKPATDRHKSFATFYDLEFRRFIGKRELFDRIFEELEKPGREKDLVSWFTYRIYRYLVHGVENAPITGPDHEIIQNIAKRMAGNKSIVASIRRYYGREIIWFGEFTAPDGSYHKGARTKTVAYKTISALLRDKIGLPERSAQKKYFQPRPITGHPRPVAVVIEEESSGLSIISIFIIVIFILALLALVT